ILDMGTVVNIVVLCDLSGQLNLNRLHTKRPAGCPRKGSILFPALPADILHMGAVLNSSGSSIHGCIRQPDFQSFHPKTLPDRTKNLIICDFTGIPDILHMTGILQISRAVPFTKRISGCSRCRITFFDQTDFHCLHPIVKSFGSGALTVFRPAKPPKLLNMSRIVYIIISGKFSRQLNLDRFHSERLSFRTCQFTILFPALPADILDVGAVPDSSGRTTGFPGSFYRDRKSTRLNSSHVSISYAVFCLKK